MSLITKIFYKYKVHKKTSSDYCWYINLSPNQSDKLGEFMYKDANLYMNRKKNKFNDLRYKMEMKKEEKKNVALD